jgi:tRNA(Arg) A34 adenosine deaminase TadA
MSTATEKDLEYLCRAVELSRWSRDGVGDMPFGAVLVRDGLIVAEGANQVVRRRDPTAHAEVVALRAAGALVGRHKFPGATLYSSGQPCPMCLCACYWADIGRVLYAADSHDIAGRGLADLEYYEEMRLPAESRRVPVDGVGGHVRQAALGALDDWYRERKAVLAGLENTI